MKPGLQHARVAHARNTLKSYAADVKDFGDWAREARVEAGAPRRPLVGRRTVWTGLRAAAVRAATSAPVHPRTPAQRLHVLWARPETRLWCREMHAGSVMPAPKDRAAAIARGPKLG